MQNRNLHTPPCSPTPAAPTVACVRMGVLQNANCGRDMHEADRRISDVNVGLIPQFSVDSLRACNTMTYGAETVQKYFTPQGTKIALRGVVKQ